MNLSVLGWIFITATLLGNAALFAVLIIRHRWKEFFVFTVLMGFESLLIPTLSGVVRFGSQSLYEQVYWSSVLIEFLLQLGVIWEIAQIVMRPTGTWLRDARKQFILGARRACAVGRRALPGCFRLQSRIFAEADWRAGAASSRAWWFANSSS
jgi:hypothetical protein